MVPHRFRYFDTVIGRCAIAWGSRGVVSVQLLHPDARELHTQLLRRFPGAREAQPTSEVEQAITGIVALLRGQAIDLSGATLDMAGFRTFHCDVYQVTRTIAP